MVRRSLRLPLALVFIRRPDGLAKILFEQPVEVPREDPHRRLAHCRLLAHAGAGLEPVEEDQLPPGALAPTLEEAVTPFAQRQHDVTLAPQGIRALGALHQ